MIVAVGTIALDSVKTPKGSRAEILGGSATFFSLSASYFNQVGLVAIVGKDFLVHCDRLLTRKEISLEGVERASGKTFRWRGEYREDWNQAHTIKTELNVLKIFRPNLPDSYRHSPYLFLANIDPDIQYQVLQQMNHPRLIFCDSMNYWIQNKKAKLLKLLKKVHGIFLNESESRELSGEGNLFDAAFKIQKMGPKIVCIKKGDHGAILANGPSVFVCPVYPWTKVKDPTGAGDSFAGGFLGYLSRCRILNDRNFRLATVYGTVMASFAVEDFSVNRLLNLTRREIQARFQKLREVMDF